MWTQPIITENQSSFNPTWLRVKPLAWERLPIWVLHSPDWLPFRASDRKLLSSNLDRNLKLEVRSCAPPISVRGFVFMLNMVWSSFLALLLVGEVVYWTGNAPSWPHRAARSWYLVRILRITFLSTLVSPVRRRRTHLIQSFKLEDGESKLPLHFYSVVCVWLWDLRCLFGFFLVINHSPH